jgi:hypothetical protein
MSLPSEGVAQPWRETVLLRLCLAVFEVVQIRIGVRQMMLDFLGQMLGVPDPAAGFTRTGCFVVPQSCVQCLNELDPFPQGLAEFVRGLVLSMHEVFQAPVPAAAT